MGLSFPEPGALSHHFRTLCFVASAAAVASAAVASAAAVAEAWHRR